MYCLCVRARVCEREKRVYVGVRVHACVSARARLHVFNITTTFSSINILCAT